MNNTKECLEYLKLHQKLKDNEWIYKTKSLRIDLELLANENPYLFSMSNRFFNEDSNDYQGWININQAYKDLKENGLLNVENNRLKIMKEKEDIFNKKLKGDYLIPEEDLINVIENKNIINFNNYLDLINKYYKFNYRDYYGKFEKKDYYKTLKISEEEYNILRFKNPDESLMCSYVKVFEDINEIINGMPYVDFWNYLLKNDFYGVTRDCVMTLEYNYNDKGYFDKECGVKIENKVLNSIRKLIFKEIERVLDNKKVDIKFHHYW